MTSLSIAGRCAFSGASNEIRISWEVRSSSVQDWLHGMTSLTYHVVQPEWKDQRIANSALPGPGTAASPCTSSKTRMCGDQVLFRKGLCLFSSPPICTA